MKENITDDEKEKIMDYIGSVYNRSRRRMEVYEYSESVQQNQNVYDNDRDLVYVIDSTLKNCGRDTRCIIRREFLENHEPGWYKGFYSRSAFYRLKKAAITEFIHCLNI